MKKTTVQAQVDLLQLLSDSFYFVWLSYFIISQTLLLPSESSSAARLCLEKNLNYSLRTTAFCIINEKDEIKLKLVLSASLHLQKS